MAVTAGVIAAVVLFGVALLHVHWARGGTWPAQSERELVELVAPPGGSRIPAGPTYVVAGLLVAASALVVAASSTDLQLVRWGALTVAAVLAARGVGGLLISGILRRTSRFARLDRRWFSPLCLTLAGLSLVAAT